MSVREAIVKDLLSALGAMQTGNGYWFDWKQIYRWRAPDAPEVPSILLLDISETVEQLAYPLHSRTLTVEIHGFHAVPYTMTDDPGEAATRLIDDIERAVMVDIARAGNAVNTRIIRTEKIVDFPSEEQVVVIVLLEIDYRTSLTDPASTN